MQPSENQHSAKAPNLTPINPGNQHAFLSATGESGGLPIAHYWRTVKQYRWSIIGIVLIATVIGMIKAVSAISIYQAHARLLVKYNQPSISNVQQFEPMPLHWLFFQTQADIIQSRAVAERVARRMKLDVPVPAADAQRQPDAESLQDRVRAWIDEAKAWIPAELRPPARPALDEKSRHDAIINGVLGAVSVEGGKESEVLVVRYISANPDLAAKFANAFAEAYIEFGLESRVTNVQQATAWLGRRIEELRRQVNESENALRKFQAEQDLVDSEKREQIISAKLASLTTELIKAQTRRSEAEARHNQVKQFLSDNTEYESIARVMNNSIVAEAIRTKTELERRVSELSERYGPKHPKMISANADLGEANKRLKVEVEKAINSARKEYELALAQERKFTAMIDEQESQMRGVSGKAFQLKQLEREVEANRELYETFLARFKEADVASEYDVPSARIIDRATPPITPFMPNRKRMVLIAVFIGLALGIGLAFLREHLNNTFKTKDDIEEKLRLPVIGIVPTLRAHRRRRAPVEREVLEDPRSPFSEAINDIRTAVLFASLDSPPKVVLITSAIPSEGKTTLASNLAIAFSKRGNTLLVDADFRKGRLNQLTRTPTAKGLADLLAGDCTEEESIVEDPEADGLSVLLAGTLPPNPLELVSSRRFADQLVRLRSRFEFIVIDGTPLLPVSDSLVLAKLVDSTIFVVRADATSRETALEALKPRD